MVFRVCQRPHSSVLRRFCQLLMSKCYCAGYSIPSMEVLRILAATLGVMCRLKPVFGRAIKVVRPMRSVPRLHSLLSSLRVLWILPDTICRQLPDQFVSNPNSDYFMSNSRTPNSAPSKEWLPDLVLHMPLESATRYPTAIEVEDSVRTTGHASSFPARTYSARETITAEQVVSKLHAQSKQSNTGHTQSLYHVSPAQKAIPSGQDSDSKVADLQHRSQSPTSVSDIMDDASTAQVSRVPEPCCQPDDCFGRRQDITGQSLSKPPNALAYVSRQPLNPPTSRSSVWMLDRWHAQPPSQEPYTCIEEVFISRVTESRTIEKKKGSDNPEDQC